MHSNTLKLSYLFILFALFPFLTSQHCNATQFAVGDRKIKVSMPSGWNGVPGLFGIPLMLVGPTKNGAQPAISISTLAAGTFETEKEYRDNRILWLQRKRGSLVKFDPYKKITWNGALDARISGVHFTLNDVQFSEKNYYVRCKDNRLFHLKAILRHDQETRFATEVDNMMKSLSCS